MFYSLSASLCDIMTEVGALNPSAWVDKVKVPKHKDFDNTFFQNPERITGYSPVLPGAFCSQSLTANKTALNQLLLKS